MNSTASRRQMLLEKLNSHASFFEDRGRIGKLLGAPEKMVVSEFSKRSGIVNGKKISTFWGGDMNITLPEPVSTFLYRYGYFEEGLTAFFIRALKKGDTFMDVGSHYGYFSLLALEMIGPEGKVIAFEPTPRTYAVLNSNLSAFPNAKTENMAAWSEDSTLELTDLGIGWSSHNSLMAPKMVPDSAAKHAQTHSVRAVKLDDYIAENKVRPALIKIDAESAELAILTGMTETMRNLRPIISVEVGDDSAVTMKSSAVLEFASRYGYQHLAYANGEIIRHEIQNAYDYDNIFMTPEEKVADLLGQ